MVARVQVEDYRGRTPLDLLSANSQKWLKQPLACDEASPEGARLQEAAKVGCQPIVAFLNVGIGNIFQNGVLGVSMDSIAPRVEPLCVCLFRCARWNKTCSYFM